MFQDNCILWLAIVAILFSASVAKSSFKFNNLKCEEHDVSFSHFEKCKLNVIGRGLVSLDLTVKLYKTPVTNISANIGIYKRDNYYRPFIYNITIDMCAFFANPNRYPVMKVVSAVFLSHSNINHTCPYSDTLVVKDFVVQEEMFALVPIANGDYKIVLKVFAYNDLKATVQMFFTRKDSIFG